MMDTIQTESVSGFRNSYDTVLKKLVQGPVLLLQRSTVAAVLVSPDNWNDLKTRIISQEQEITELKAQLRNALLDKYSLEMRYVPGMSTPWEQIQQELNTMEPVHA